MIVKRKLYSGKGTQAIYKIMSPFYRNKVAAKRATIKTKKPLEKAGHAIADRWAITAAVAGPMVPVPVVSQVGAAVYAIKPEAAKALPGVGKLITKVEQTNAIKATAKPVHKVTDNLFRAGSRQRTFSNPWIRKAIRKVGNKAVETRDAFFKGLRLVPNPKAEMMDRLIAEEGRKHVKELSNSTAKLVPGNLKQIKPMYRGKKYKTLRSIDNAGNYIRSHSAGEIASDFTGKFIENPTAVAGTAAGYAMVPLTGIYIPGTTAMSVGAEALVKKAKPYEAITKGGKKIYDQPIPKTVRNVKYVLTRGRKGDVVAAKKAIKAKQRLERVVPSSPKDLVRSAVDSTMEIARR